MVLIFEWAWGICQLCLPIQRTMTDTEVVWGIEAACAIR